MRLSTAVPCSTICRPFDSSPVSGEYFGFYFLLVVTLWYIDVSSTSIFVLPTAVCSFFKIFRFISNHHFFLRSPQHNVLYPCLTVLEHLYFFGNVKGMYGAKLRASVESVIEEVGLTEKRNALSQALSGGMKRKLSLAIALIGDPKFLLLDGKFCYFSSFFGRQFLSVPPTN